MSKERLDTNKKHADKILAEIFQINSPKIDTSREDEIREFVETTINGDSTEQSLVINATLEKDKQGILVYILTNLRLIKIEIGETEGLKSSSFFMSSVAGVEREMIEKGRIKVNISFQSGSVGLRYSTSNQNITDFFQQVESQGKGSTSNG